MRRGEGRGLSGETVSGKPTVTSIMAGMLKPDSGEMTCQGAPWHPATMIDARHKGVSMILQEMNGIFLRGGGGEPVYRPGERIQLLWLRRPEKMKAEGQKNVPKIENGDRLINEMLNECNERRDAIPR